MLQTCNVYIMKLAMGYIHIPSFIILGSCIYGLRHINGLYHTCNVYIMKLAMGYMSIPSFIILGSCIYEVHHINGLYHNVWPMANSGHFLLFTSKQNC